MAFGALVERHQNRMMAYAVHMGCDPDQAADVVQDGLIRAYRHLARCGDPTRFAGWLFRIVVNVCRSRLKAGRCDDVDLGELAPLVPCGSPGPVRNAEISATRDRVIEALRKLPLHQREALVLKYVEGQSLKEMQRLTGASQSALKMRLKRGREALKDELADLVATE